MKDTINMVDQSKVLNTPGAEKQTKRELFDALRQELEAPALERASTLVWDLILDNDGLGKEINDTVERIFCQLSGCEPPLFPPVSEVQLDEVKEIENTEIEKENDHLDSSSKKRDFGEMSVQIEEGEVAEHTNDPPSIPIGSGSSVTQKKKRKKVPGSRAVTADSENNVVEEPRRRRRTDGNNLSIPVGSVPDSNVTKKKKKENIVEDAIRCIRSDGKGWRCTWVCVQGQKYCERHVLKRKKPKQQVEDTKQGTSSDNMVDSSPKISSLTPSEPRPMRKRKKPRQQVEDTKQGTSSDNMVDSSPKISSLTPSEPRPMRKHKKPKQQVEDTKQGTSSDNMVDSSPKISSLTPSIQKRKKPKQPVEDTKQGTSSYSMVDSSPKISSSMPSEQVTVKASPRPSSSTRGALKSDDQGRTPKQQVENTNQGTSSDIMVDSVLKISSSTPSELVTVRVSPRPSSSTRGVLKSDAQGRTPKQQVEYTNQGTSSDIMVDSGLKISSSTPSELVTVKASPMPCSSTRGALKGDAQGRTPNQQVENTNQGTSSGIMVDSGPKISSSTPSELVTVKASPRPSSSTRGALKGDAQGRTPNQQVENTNQGTSSDIMVESGPKISSSMPFELMNSSPRISNSTPSEQVISAPKISNSAPIVKDSPRPSSPAESFLF